MVAALGGEPTGGAGAFDPYRPPAPGAPAQLLHADDMYEGWDGLETLDAVLVDQVIEPLAAGRGADFRMWDWHQSRRTHRIPVDPRAFLVVEGVGVGQRSARRCAALLLWVDAPEAERLARGVARDGEGMRAEWLRWQPREAAHFAREGTRAAADLVIDGTSPIPD